MKVKLVAICFLCALVFSGCKNKLPAPYYEDYKSVKQVGEVPEVFQDIVAKDLFNGATAFDGKLMKTEVCSRDVENGTVVQRVSLMDLYGKEIAAYTCSSDETYRISTVIPTDDGGFLFVLGFSDKSYGEGVWASDKGYASHIIKCDKNGVVQFDTPLESVTGRAVRFCISRDGKYYFFGDIETPETKVQGVGSPTDVYMTVLNENGEVLKTNWTTGSDYDNLNAVEIADDAFLLSIAAQSCDGDFIGSDSNGYRRDWVFTVNEDLEIIEKQKASGREALDDRIGEKDGVLVYKSDERLKDFDAGRPETFIDYGDFYLIVSQNITGVYENTPIIISSIWYYTETVYSAYNNNGELIFRTSVDSTPDYDAIFAEMNLSAIEG